MRTKLLTQDTTTEIVTLEEAMEHSRITDSYDEMVVQGALDAAHDLVQQWLNRKLYPSTIIGQIINFRPRITLPYPPIESVTSVKAEDCNGDEVILVEGVDWKFDFIGETIRFIGNTNPTLSEFTFEYSAGYQTIDSVPNAVKHAIKMTFATLYENREDTVIGLSINSVPLTARRVLASHRVSSQT
jgi:uncharacterized phiE125 gp8 family phage protein